MFKMLLFVIYAVKILFFYESLMAKTQGTETNHCAQWWQTWFTAYGTDPEATLKEQYVWSEYKIIINSSDMPSDIRNQLYSSVNSSQPESCHFRSRVSVFMFVHDFEHLTVGSFYCINSCFCTTRKINELCWGWKKILILWPFSSL